MPCGTPWRQPSGMRKPAALQLLQRDSDGKLALLMRLA
jgi:hypothetical protein